MNIKQFITEYEENKRLSTTEPENAPFEVRPGLAIAKNTATVRLQEMAKQYRDFVRDNSINVFVTGPKADEFADTAIGETGGVKVNADEIYDRVTKHVAPSVGHRGELGITQYHLLVEEISEIGRELELEELNSPSVPNGVIAPTTEAVKQKMKELIRSSQGDSFNALYLLKCSADEALKELYSQNVVPVYYVTASTEEAESLSKLLTGKQAAIVETKGSDEIDNNYVIKTLTKIKKKNKLENN